MYSKPYLNSIPMQNITIKGTATNSSLMQTGYVRLMATPESMNNEYQSKPPIAR